MALRVESGAEFAGPAVFVEAPAEDGCVILPAESEPEQAS